MAGSILVWDGNDRNLEEKSSDTLTSFATFRFSNNIIWTDKRLRNFSKN